MKKVLKIIAWLSCGLVALLVVLMITAYFIGSSGNEWAEEGLAFAENATKDDCLDEAARRLSTCNDAIVMSCLVPNIAFGNACFDHASGSSEPFCADRRAKTLPKDYCAVYESNPLCNQGLTGIVAAHCEELANNTRH
ncbi:MAG: hypothetical protein KUG79_07275 [Pseudomonadales bacterium]|nr:hypothetical protein [Pseudomonadales bacterium]